MGAGPAYQRSRQTLSACATRAPSAWRRYPRSVTTAPVRADLPARLPRYKDTPRQRGRVPLIVLVILTAIAGLLGGIGISFSAGNPYGAGLSMFYAFIPLPALWLAYWWLDRYEPEPPRYKYAAFVWGGVVAVAIALSLQLAIQKTFHLSDETMASFVAPVTEEPAKCMFLLLTFVRMRRVIDGFIDGLVYAGLVGIGFSFVENIGYYAASYLGSADMKLRAREISSRPRPAPRAVFACWAIEYGSPRRSAIASPIRSRVACGSDPPRSSWRIRA